ncbi:MAG: hypothetical protein Q7S76_01195, partial [bacterium]|nr:hypothetical protein [bacterium]
ELTRAFDHLGPQEVSEQLTLILNERTGGDGAAAMVFGVEMPAGNNGPVETNLPSHRTEIFRSILRKFWKFPQQIAKNARAYAIFVLFALFALSVFFGVRKQVGVQKNKEIAEKLTAIEHSYDEGAALLELNTLKGRERLVSAKTELGVLLSQTTDRTKEGRRVRALLAEVESAITQAMQIYHGEPSVFYDIHLLKPGGEITDISLSGDALGILDRTTGTVFQILLSSKNAQVIAGGASFMGSTLLSSQTDTAYVGVTRGISRIKTTSPTQVPVIPSNEEWGSITDMVSFGGNLYLLDTQKSRIWKYVATADGFSDRREYLNPDTLPDLSKGTTLSIDGTVWISTRDGKILRFIQGQESTFLVQGVEPPLGTDLLLFTDDVSTNLYVYDPLVRRIVVLDKDGVYLAQYRWDEPLNVSSFVVSEAQKKLYLASGSTIYVLDVK